MTVEDLGPSAYGSTGYTELHGKMAGRIEYHVRTCADVSPVRLVESQLVRMGGRAVLDKWFYLWYSKAQIDVTCQ